MDIRVWMQEFVKRMEAVFGEELWLIGLQGSYGRQEATAESDIDVVVIWKTCDMETLERYAQVMATLPEREKLCGFVSGLDELLHWDGADLLSFYYDTTPWLGSLELLRDKITADTVQRGIHRGVCDIYHACVHNLLHEKSDAVLREGYKSAVFVIEAIFFLRSGRYERRHVLLLQQATGQEKEILCRAEQLRKGEPVQLREDSMRLMQWASRWMTEMDTMGKGLVSGI